MAVPAVPTIATVCPSATDRSRTGSGRNPNSTRHQQEGAVAGTPAQGCSPTDLSSGQAFSVQSGERLALRTADMHEVSIHHYRKSDGSYDGGPLKNLPHFSSPPSVVAVLAISPHDDDHACLREIFSHTRWQIFEARSRLEALSFLEKNRVGVLLCESDLPDGNWKDLLENVSGSSQPPLLIVTSRHVDDVLWAEALNLGAYDVVSKPFERVEVTRVISLAWLHWRDEIAERTRKPASKGSDVGGLQKRSATA